MTKAQKQKQRREKLEKYIASVPGLEKVLDAKMDESQEGMIMSIEDVMKAKLEKARLQGVQIGWSTFAKQAIKHIENMETVDEIKSYFQAEADKMDEKLGIKKD